MDARKYLNELYAVATKIHKEEEQEIFEFNVKSTDKILDSLRSKYTKQIKNYLTPKQFIEERAFEKEYAFYLGPSEPLGIRIGTLEFAKLKDWHSEYEKIGLDEDDVSKSDFIMYIKYLITQNRKIYFFIPYEKKLITDNLRLEFTILKENSNFNKHITYVLGWFSIFPTFQTNNPLQQMVQVKKNLSLFL